MPCVSLQRMLPKFQEKSSDLEKQLFELGFFCDTKGDTLESPPTHQVKMSLFHTSKWGKRKTKCQRETPTPSLEIVF